jgi:hypothetical protein
LSGRRKSGPAWRRGALPAVRGAKDFERHLSVGSGGFTLHAATRAGGQDERGREALLKYVLRPPIAQERITQGPDGLVRHALKKPFSDGTTAIDLDPLSLLTRLCAAVPPPRFHTVRYAGVLGAGSKLRSRIVPVREEAPSSEEPESVAESERKPHHRGCRYWSWSELLKRTFALDVLSCAGCGGRLRLVAMMMEPKSIERYLRALGEPTEGPPRTPARGPPFYEGSQVVVSRFSALVLLAHPTRMRCPRRGRSPREPHVWNANVVPQSVALSTMALPPWPFSLTTADPQPSDRAAGSDEEPIVVLGLRPRCRVRRFGWWFR